MADTFAFDAAPVQSKESAKIRPIVSREEWGMRAGLGLLALYLAVTIAIPLFVLLRKSVEDADGNFVGLANFAKYFADPALFRSFENSFFISITGTVITLVLAFWYAYAITRTCMPARGLFKALALVPLLAPSLLPGLALVYLFGNQGIFKVLMMGGTIYGPTGIIIGEVFFGFPHAVLIITTALAMADQRLYEAAAAMRASPMRTFFTVTLPGCRYGVMSAGFVIFTLIFTDFGVPKVIGGSYDVLATDIYQQVIGQFNFQMGAVIGLLLLAPALLSFAADRITTRRQQSMVSSRAVPLEPKPRPGVDRACFALATVIAIFLLGVMAMAAYGSVVKFWPYNLSLTLTHYDFGKLGTDGWNPFWNSLKLSAFTAVFGTAIVFAGAYLVEKLHGFGVARSVVHLLAMLPLATPGLVLGLSYIFFFNSPNNPLNFIYATLSILIICTITHFYTVCHLTAVTALKQLDAEFEAVSASLKVPIWRTFLRVTVPVCLPAILDIAIYYFVNAMTTVSAVIFIYTGSTKLMAINALNTDDAGNTAAACAMGMTIVLTCALVRGFHALAGRTFLARHHAWRKRAAG
jgi:iron(III) transport system permease protein